ncbi:hypothetical protein [Amycolatopsis thermophila]|uniref:Uncharacterized protein n=1 Tax=Amycolatopsis thermophila TaxID=206084 RepID=A0ABU0ENH7_9PSEU|nr:hypothetical protein [Amycolatopsis thermophila]MDQ0376551.1 hypothetical protein [Amycolatopsis thermophila]
MLRILGQLLDELADRADEDAAMFRRAAGWLTEIDRKANRKPA